MNTSANSSAPRFVIVVGIAASGAAEHVLDAATKLARGIAGSELHLVHAIEPEETEGLLIAEAHERALAHGRAFLDEKAKGAQRSSGVPVVGHLREAYAAKAIVQTAASIDADLVMVGTSNRKGLARLALGSVAERVMRDAACPVLVVREKHHASDLAPEIEPPCPDCLSAQRASRGAKLWCARHSAHHPIAHLHYAMPEGFGEGSSLIRS